MGIEASHAHFVLVLFFLVYSNGRWQWMGWLGSAWAPFVTWRAWNFLRRIGGNFQSKTIIICQRYMWPHLNGIVYLICLIFVWFLLWEQQPNDFRTNHKRSREGERDLLHTTLNNTWPNIMRFDGAGNSVSQFIRGQNDLCQIHINMPSIIAVPYGTKHLRLIRMLSNPFRMLFGEIQTKSRRFIAKIICQHWYPACICRNQYGLVLRIPFEA